MLAAVVAEVVCHERCGLHDLTAVVILAVEAPERVDVGTLEAVLAHLVLVVIDELPHLLAVGRTARSIAHRVDGELEVRRIEAEALVELHEHDDALGIGCRICRAEPFDADLVELAQASLLRTLATEHRFRIPELRRRRSLRHEVVLHSCTHDACRAFRPHGHALLRLESLLRACLKQVLEEGARDDAEHLLAHDVGGFSDAMDKGIDLLDGRRLDHIEAIGAEEVACDILHMLPAAHVSAIEVLGTLNLLCHQRLLPAC